MVSLVVLWEEVSCPSCGTRTRRLIVVEGRRFHLVHCTRCRAAERPVEEVRPGA